MAESEIGSCGTFTLPATLPRAGPNEHPVTPTVRSSKANHCQRTGERNRFGFMVSGGNTLLLVEPGPRPASTAPRTARRGEPSVFSVYARAPGTSRLILAYFQ